MQLVQRLLSDGCTRQGLDILEVAEGLRKLGHTITIRSALGGGGGNECLRNLRHRFLTCRVQGIILLLFSWQRQSYSCYEAWLLP